MYKIRLSSSNVLFLCYQRYVSRTSSMSAVSLSVPVFYIYVYKYRCVVVLSLSLRYIVTFPFNLRSRTYISVYIYIGNINCAESFTGKFIMKRMDPFIDVLVISVLIVFSLSRDFCLFRSSFLFNDSMCIIFSSLPAIFVLIV